MTHNFDLVAFSTFLGPVYWYGCVYTLGIAGVFAWFWIRGGTIGMTRRDVVTFSILFSLSILIGARMFDIVFYEFEFYASRPLAALNLWNGGMASHGVLAGALVAALAFSRARHIPLLAILDELVIPGALLLAIGRVGNFIEGGVIGSVTSSAWGVTFADVEGARHPVALYESAKNLLLIPILLVATRRWPAGTGVSASLFVLLYSGLRFAVDLFRDYEAEWLGIGTGQVLNLAMAAAGGVMLTHFLRSPGHPVRRPIPGHEANPGLVGIVILCLLAIYPLGIPTSWTRENIVAMRAEDIEAAR